MTAPTPGAVHVWRFDLDKEDAPPKFLSADEHARVARFSFEQDARRWQTGRSLLRRTLGDYLAADPAALKFETGQFGKPSLPDCSLRFNVTHSGSLFLLALAWDEEVGIDAERLRADFVPEDLAAQVLSPREIDTLRMVPPAGRHTAFLSLWTAKEAYVKALGVGLSFPLPLLTLTPSGGGCYEAEDLSRADTGLTMSVRSLSPPPGVAASLAVVGPLSDIQYYAS